MPNDRHKELKVFTRSNSPQASEADGDNSKAGCRAFTARRLQLERGTEDHCQHRGEPGKVWRVRGLRSKYNDGGGAVSCLLYVIEEEW